MECTYVCMYVCMYVCACVRARVCVCMYRLVLVFPCPLLAMRISLHNAKNQICLCIDVMSCTVVVFIVTVIIAVNNLVLKYIFFVDSVCQYNLKISHCPHV